MPEGTSLLGYLSDDNKACVFPLAYKLSTGNAFECASGPSMLKLDKSAAVVFDTIDAIRGPFDYGEFLIAFLCFFLTVVIVFVALKIKKLTIPFFKKLGLVYLLPKDQVRGSLATSRRRELNVFEQLLIKDCVDAGLLKQIWKRPCVDSVALIKPEVRLAHETHEVFMKKGGSIINPGTAPVPIEIRTLKHPPTSIIGIEIALPGNVYPDLYRPRYIGYYDQIGARPEGRRFCAFGVGHCKKSSLQNKPFTRQHKAGIARVLDCCGVSSRAHAQLLPRQARSCRRPLQCCKCDTYWQVPIASPSSPASCKFGLVVGRGDLALLAVAMDAWTAEHSSPESLPKSNPTMSTVSYVWCMGQGKKTPSFFPGLAMQKERKKLGGETISNLSGPSALESQ
ncbi:hypothetical protein KC330_g180 [Hortaea werneckii]|nr:hypothetical protein KC330_g180 [Hortaea werneckii]